MAKINQSSEATQPQSGQQDDRYRVYSAIPDSLQRPLAGAVVKAFDKDIRSEQMLGRTATTDASRAYHTVYIEKDFAATDLPAPDIVVRVFGKEKRRLKESQVFYNATREPLVDIGLSDRSYHGPSEFEHTQKRINPSIGKLPPSELSGDQKLQDITFLVHSNKATKRRFHGRFEF